LDSNSNVSLRYSSLELWRPGGWLGVVACLVCVLVVSWASLLSAPPVHVDEAWNANRAWWFLQTGRAFGSMDAGVVERYQNYWTFMPWLGTAVYSMAIAIFGPSLLAVRLASYAFGLVLLAALFVIATRLYDWRTGVLAALLGSTSSAFIYSSHIGRHDILVAALGYSAIALYVAGRAKPWHEAVAVGAGLLVGLTLDVHPNGAVFAPVLMALCLEDSRWSVTAMFRGRRFWGLVVGVGIGVAHYVARHVIPSVDTFLALHSLGPTPERLPPILSLVPSLWIESLLQSGTVLLGYNLWTAPLVVGGTGLLLRRRENADRTLLITIAVLVTAFAAVIRAKSGFYAILLSPAASLLAASCLAGCLRHLSHLLEARPRRAVRITIVRATIAGSLITASLGAIKTLVQYDSFGEFRSITHQVAAVLPSESVVMGPQSYWFELPPQQNYLSWEQLAYYMNSTHGASLEDAFRALRPDYFIFDAQIAQFLSDDPRREHSPATSGLLLSKTEMNDFLHEHGTPVLTVEMPDQDTMSVYRLRW
jgi:4-amino-4-deoxy-L-arabinose transferase-like glycosyltransferase